MKILCLLFFFLFVSCFNVEKNARSKDLENIFQRVIYTEEILEVNEELSQNIIIHEPKDTWQFLFKIKLKLTDDSYLIDCLFYKVPSEKEDGVLKLKSQQLGEDCKEDYLSRGKWEVAGIKDFSFAIASKGLSFSISEQMFKFPLLNTKSIKNVSKLFESGIKNDIELIGEGVLEYKLSERYQVNNLKEGDLCHKLENTCEESLSFSCNRCPNGVYTQIISSNCRKAYNKVCGDISCGGVKELACIRGFEATKFKFNYCINDSPVGFCHEGLRVYCKDQKLICDY